MKTSTAMATASIMGVGLATLSGAPAQAADVTVDCTSVSEHQPSATASADNWYMDCVPQYGLGKVEFTIDSEVDFPDAFVPLNDPSVVSSSVNTGLAASTYFDATPPPAGFVSLSEESATPTTRVYGGSMMFAISSVSSILVSELPAACGIGPFTNAYRVEYLPATVTFTQTIDGQVWTYVVQYTPSPLYLGLNFTSEHDFDGNLPQCASSTTGTTLGTISGSPEWYQVINSHATAIGAGAGWLSSISPFPMADSEPIGQLGTFALQVPEPEPALADTGADATGLGMAGGLSLLAGLALSVFWRRGRKRA